MKKILFLLIPIILFSCDTTDAIYMREVEDHGWETVEDVMVWVAKKIDYEPDDDVFGNWFTPQRTYTLRYGDCEDFAILALYICKEFLDIEGEMYASTTHAWVKIDGQEWEPTLGVLIEFVDYDYPHKYTYSYESVMHKAQVR